ncbi:hypothetical protein BGZ99_006956 [Dissophora globulifera]|uniref:N-acetyltransferase domain-containing protein n=1 Tax=Dissophora globulifera TaxID=979702 RepID=A0A9P6RDK4_9FUNG|nr:hypothetical protein BGZ99_006956 [Dissophora globulifera]
MVDITNIAASTQSEKVISVNSSQETVTSYPLLDYVVPNVDEHQDLLRAMRKACGWGLADVPQWFVQQSEGTRIMVVFYQHGTKTPAGMGAVELIDFDHGDKDVADLDSKRGSIVSLFLYKKFRGKGYLGRILLILEEIAREEKGLEIVTLYGLSLAGGYEKFGYKTFKMQKRNYGGNNNWDTRYLQKSLREQESQQLVV